MSILGSFLTPIVPPVGNGGEGATHSAAFIPPDAGQLGGTVVTDSSSGVSTDSSDSHQSDSSQASAATAERPQSETTPRAAPGHGNTDVTRSGRDSSEAPGAGQFRAVNQDGKILVEVSNGDVVELTQEELESNPELRRLLFEKMAMQGSIMLDLKALKSASVSTNCGERYKR